MRYIYQWTALFHRMLPFASFLDSTSKVHKFGGFMIFIKQISQVIAFLRNDIIRFFLQSLQIFRNHYNEQLRFILRWQQSIIVDMNVCLSHVFN